MRCLDELAAGDEEAIGRIIPLLYDDLRALARKIQPAGGSLNPTALVHEAYARLVQAGAKPYNDRLHFMRVAALAMRQLLTDRAREQRRAKRGGNAQRITLQPNDGAAIDTGVDLVQLDEVLTKFSEQYPRPARVVELRYFAGLTVEEAAEILEVSPRTVKVDWQMAGAWLSRELRNDANAD